MKVKTADLVGTQLDIAVAVALGGVITRPQDAQVYLNEMHLPCGEEAKKYSRYVFSPSTDWSQRGPLIDEYCIWLSDDEGNFVASCEPHIGRYVVDGATSLIAICRALVLAKLGDEVDIPDELID